MVTNSNQTIHIFELYGVATNSHLPNSVNIGETIWKLLLLRKRFTDASP